MDCIWTIPLVVTLLALNEQLNFTLADFCNQTQNWKKEPRSSMRKTSKMHQLIEMKLKYCLTSKNA